MRTKTKSVGERKKKSDGTKIRAESPERLATCVERPKSSQKEPKVLMKWAKVRWSIPRESGLESQPKPYPAGGERVAPQREIFRVWQNAPARPGQ